VCLAPCLALSLGLGLALGLACTPTAAAHDLQHTITSGGAVVIELRFADGTPFTFESYEIFPQGTGTPIQVGRTDAQGRIAFLPDRAGVWRLRAFANDGHGLDIDFTTDAAAAVGASDMPAYQRHARLFVGLGLIFGIFGLVSLFYRRRAT
jgi:nickel transport protein